MFLMKKMKFIIFSSIFLFSIISKASSYSSSYNSSLLRRLSTHSKDTLEKRNEKLYSNSTSLTSTGKGSILKLAEHKIECPRGQALNAIHLWGKWNAFSDNQFAYQYNCLPSNSFGQESIKKTNEVDVNKDPANSLDTLNNLAITCDNGSVLKRIQMNNGKGNKKVLYSYTCVKANTQNCQKRETKELNIQENYVGKKIINQLSQFHVDADPNTFLQSVRFITNNSKGKYQYTFCQVNPNSKNQNQKGNANNNNQIIQQGSNPTAIPPQGNQPRTYFRKRLKRRGVNPNNQTRINPQNNQNQNNQNQNNQNQNIQQNGNNQQNRNNQQNDNNSQKKKIPIQQNSAENFCKTKCVQGNQPKKCYINGNVGQCSSCKYSGQLTGQKEQKIQKICFQLCNFIPSQGTCKSFAYILKLKVDSKLLEEFGLKRKY